VIEREITTSGEREETGERERERKEKKRCMVLLRNESQISSPTCSCMLIY
jgi:hypothetical protein